MVRNGRVNHGGNRSSRYESEVVVKFLLISGPDGQDHAMARDSFRAVVANHWRLSRVYKQDQEDLAPAMAQVMVLLRDSVLRTCNRW